MTAPLLTPEALAAVGREKPLRHGIIAASDIRKYCAAVDESNPLYADQEVAIAAGYSDIIAPPLFPFVATRPVPFTANLLDDGQLDDLAPPGLRHLQSMAASQEWEIFRPAVVGEEVIERVKFGSIEEKQGRNGNVVFVSEEGLVTTASGEPIVKTVTHIAFRPIPSSGAAASADNAAAVDRPVDRPTTVVSDNVLIKRPSMISVFMFAASIWAVHRIHYDAPYARSEGLPAPLIPGWMLAQFLAEFAAGQGRGSLRHLAVRYQSFALAGDELTCRVTGEDDGSGLAMAVVNQAGTGVASGTAKFA